MNQVPVKVSEHRLDNWLFVLTEHHILKSFGPERNTFEAQLELPAIPEMIFDKNCLAIYYCKTGEFSNIPSNSSMISFNALDALKLVDSKNVTIEVPIAKDWRDARANQDDLVSHKPYDWTFTTNYNGTLKGDWIVQPSCEGLDMEYLQRKDPIQFFTDTTLFEDELGDNGISILNVKFRAMTSGFFLLQRFFLRIDGSLVRVHDTRVQWRREDKYLIRDVRRSESSSWKPEMMSVDLLVADKFCDIELEHYSEKLEPTSL